MRRTLPLLFLLGVTGVACGDDLPTIDLDTDGDTNTSTTGGDSDAGTAVDSTGEPQAEPFARGVTISRVEANSGTAIAISDAGEVIPVEDRNARLPAGRNTAVRVYVDIDEDVWVQRDIEARLEVYLADGTVETLSLTETIAADSSTSNLQSNFLFGVIDEWMTADTQWRLALYETDEDFDAIPAPAEPPVIPPEGVAPLGVEEDELRMKIMLVPVHYDGPGCSAQFDTSMENVARYEEALFQHNPTQSVDIELHEPMVIDAVDLSSTAGFYVLLLQASQLRADDDPEPWVYYYVVFDNCGACIPTDGSGGTGGCLLGVAPNLAEDTQGAASIRVSIGTSSLFGDDGIGPDTFVHELGHNQGRAHIACPGAAAAGPDASYPYESGGIGVWGFGVRDFQIRNTNHKDYMSYCNPTWVSDWQWEATFDRISTLTQWEDDTEAPIPGGILQGAFDPTTGEVHWWTARGSVEGLEGDPRYAVAVGEQSPVTPVVGEWSEGPWLTLRAPLPDALALTEVPVTLTAPGPDGKARTLVVPGTDVHRAYRPTSLRPE